MVQSIKLLTIFRIRPFGTTSLGFFFLISIPQRKLIIINEDVVSQAWIITSNNIC